MVCSLRNLILIICLALSCILGCENREVSKKVSLEERSPEIERHVESGDEDTFKFGFDLRLGPKEDVRIYLPFLKYLEKRTGIKFSIEFTQKYDDTINNLGTGITHFAALGPVSAVIAKERYDTGCLAIGLNQDGKAEYRGIIFTTTDSPIDDIKDLKGKTFAFENKLSTQGHIIPRKMLEDEGILLEDLNSFTFTGSHADTARAVMKGDYDAGGMQDCLAKRLMAEGKIKILAISDPYPSSRICFNRNVNPDIVKTVKAALLSFDPKGKHASILVDWEKTEMPNGFVEYKKASLTGVRDLVKKYGLLK